MTRTSVRALAFACAFTGVASFVHAQDVEEDPAERARFRFGPLRLTPVIDISNLGRDTNVFNEAENPKADTTAAFGPGTQFWVLAGRSRLSGRVGVQYLYFHEYASQRGWNTDNNLRWEVPLAYMTPFIAGTYVNSRERQGYEIDSRSRRRDVSGTVGTSLHLSGKTDLVASFRRFQAEYDQEETFLGSTLAGALNRDEETIELQLRQKLTPLTTFVVSTQHLKDRFETSEFRDSDSLKIMPGFEFKPLALISGSAFVGYRRFNAVDQRVPDYQGLVAAVKARYTLTSTRFDADVDRDLAYSYQIAQPYYGLLDVRLAVTQRITYNWDIVGRTSWQRLDYRGLAGELDVFGKRVDTGHEYGAGFGYRMGETMRIGVDALYSTRRSQFIEVRNYEGFRLFSSISYGSQQ